MRSNQSLIWLAVGLFVLWIVLRGTLAFTGGYLHLLWIGAIIFVLVWFFRNNFTGRHNPRS
ncbi:MAG: hypothetical protein EOP84_09040 [Verrucomicrobiaceae bacterium]|nr:MAG: hypothetical protein EOP84_09040 [Verrucomicrobiaceae bacterium]